MQHITPLFLYCHGGEDLQVGQIIENPSGSALLQLDLGSQKLEYTARSFTAAFSLAFERYPSVYAGNRYRAA